ncbi:MAG: hypothetical protein GY791_06100 [Alphaproteobacteria bacterium]|nr:hypothetical protein [Alphaproteobacteria bacterium]
MQARQEPEGIFDAETWVRHAESLGYGLTVLIDRETLKPGQIRLALPGPRPLPPDSEADPLRQICMEPSGSRSPMSDDRWWANVRDYLLASGRYSLAAPEDSDS